MTIAGSSCGVRPTAIASANRADWRSERPSAALITKIEPASTAVTVASRREKSCSPCWNAVTPCRSPRRTAIAPNAVREPVRTTTPRPPPPLTSVPMNAHEPQIQGRVPRRLSLGRLLGRPRLAGQHRLVALELVHLEQPQIGRNHIADPQMHDITRNQLCHGDLGRSAVAVDRGKMLDLGMQLLDRLLRAVLVEEAQTDAHRHDRADDQRLRQVADHRRDHRRDEQQQEQVAAQLTDEHRPGTDPVRGQHVRPVDPQTPARLGARKTRIGRAELAQHIRHRQRRGGGELELLRLGRRSVRRRDRSGCRIRCRLNHHRLSPGSGSTRVPASRERAPAASPSAPIAAIPPGPLDEAAGGLDLRCHRARLETHPSQLSRCGLLDPGGPLVPSRARRRRRR